MNHKEIIQIINEIEVKFPIERWAIDDIYVWPIIRSLLFFNIYYSDKKKYNNSNAFLFQKAKKLVIYALGFLKYLNAYIFDYNRNFGKIIKCNALFLTYTNHRIKIKKQWFDRFCDTFNIKLEKMGISSLILEISSKDLSFPYKFPRYSKSSFIQCKIDRIILINRLFNTSKPKLKINLYRYYEFVDYLANNNLKGFSISKSELIKYVLDIKKISNYFEKILNKANPECIFLVQYYSTIGWALNYAAVKKGIPTIDIQHGLQGDYHVSYGSWKNVPSKGYNLLPKFFWCWSETEVNAINSWRSQDLNTHIPINGGDQFLDLWKNNYFKVDKITTSKLKYISESGKLFLLFTSSYLGDLPDWVLSSLYEFKDKIFFCVRLHPNDFGKASELRSKLLLYGFEYFDVEKMSNLPLPLLLRYTNLNITSISSTVIEAATMNVRSIIIDKSVEDIYKDYISTGMVLCAYNSFDLKTIINSQLLTNSKLLTQVVVTKTSFPFTESINYLFKLNQR